MTKIKERFQTAISLIASAAHNVGLSPNGVSVIGFLISIISALLYYWHPSRLYISLAAILLLLSGFCDALDGTLAKMYGQTTIFGAFLDSTLDRVSDAVIFSSLILGGLCSASWGLAALIGALLVSYTRAKGESVGVPMAAVGVAERAERILIIAATSFLEFFLIGAVETGIVVVALISFLTVVQRIVHVYRKVSS